MHLQNIIVRPISKSDSPRFQKLMQAYHYLGALPKIGNTIQYIATYHDDWLALIVFSAAALKCSARDQWIGWGCRGQDGRSVNLPGQSYFRTCRPASGSCGNRLLFAMDSENRLHWFTEVRQPELEPGWQASFLLKAD